MNLMSQRDLKELQQRMDALPRAEQLELALYLLHRNDRTEVNPEALLSEAALAKDWLRPEEDKAWANL
jgi:hypothetical protein